MAFDWPHMAASAAIIFIVVLLVNKLTEGVSRGKRTLITFVAILVPLLILNIIWPYGDG